MPVYDSDQHSKSSSNSIVAQESPQPFVTDLKAKSIRRRPSVFSTTQSIESLRDRQSNDTHPLKLISSRVVQECEEAASKDAEPLISDTDSTKTSVWRAIWLFLWDHIRPDFLLSHLNWESFKIVSKSWIVTFVAIILICIKPVLNYLGNAAYIMIIATCIETAGGITIAHAVYSSVADLALVLFAFTCNVIAHTICWRIRGYPTQQSVMADLVEQGVCQFGDVRCLAHEIFAGRYLSTRTTVVSMCGMFSAITINGYLQTKSMFFLPSWILSAICTVITGVYLNFTPYFDPWSLGKVIVVPLGFAFALRFVVSVLYFPVSSNRKFYSVIVTSLKSIYGVLDNTLTDLSQTKPSDSNYNVLLEKLTISLPTTLNMFALLELEGIWSRWEFAYSRLDPGDLGEFRSLVRMLVNTFSGCRFYFDHISEKSRTIAAGMTDSERSNSDDQKQAKDSSLSSSAKSSNNDSPSLLPRLSSLVPILSKRERSPHQKDLEDIYEDTAKFEKFRLKQADLMNSDSMDIHDLDMLHERIMSHYADLTKSIHSVVKTISDWAEEANKFRIWAFISPRYRKKRIIQQKEKSISISKALDELKLQFDGEQKSDFKAWLQDYCESTTFKSRQQYLYCLGMDSFYGCSLERVARSVQRAATYCMFLDTHQPEPRWIFPFMKTRSKAPRFEKEYMSKGVLGFDMDSVPTAFQPTTFTQRRNPDSSPPRNLLHLFGRQILGVWSFLNDPNIIYITKRAVFTLISCLTYFSRTTALWSYNYRLVWVPIMVALTVTAKAVDGVYGFVMKITFTFVGSLAGMIIWYMGDGHGTGNPYGFAAAASAVMAILLAYRHFHKLAIPMGPIVMCVTAILVSETSWVDSNTAAQDIRLGKGFHVAWIRFVEVSAALLIAFIATLLPHPVTAKKEVRVLLGKSLETFGDCQTSVANFAMGRHKDPTIHILQRQDLIIQKLRGIKVSNLSIRSLTKQIRYEPPLGGVWPRHKFELLTKLVWELCFLLEDVFFFIDDVKLHTYMPMILRLMGWTNIELTSGLYSVLVLGSRALYTGSPLPSVTPGHLGDVYSHHLREVFNASTDNMNVDLEGLLEDKYVCHDGRLALAMTLTSSAIFERADGCIQLIKELVGEMYDLDMTIYTHDDELPLVPFTLDEKQHQLQ